MSKMLSFKNSFTSLVKIFSNLFDDPLESRYEPFFFGQSDNVFFLWLYFVNVKVNTGSSKIACSWLEVFLLLFLFCLFLLSLIQLKIWFFELTCCQELDFPSLI